MKRFLFVFLAALCFLSSPAFAKTKAEEDVLAEMRKKVAEKREELNGSEWQITIKPQAGVSKPTVLDADTLTFQNGKFISSQMTKKGFAQTNYTVTVQGDGPAVWETMQTSSDKTQGVAFWRGEWKDELLTGVIVRQLPEKPNEEYYFTSSVRKSIPPSSSEEGGGEAKKPAIQSLSSSPAQELSAPSSRQSSTYVASPSPNQKKEKKRLASFW